ncbi:MAG: NAD-dependent epimerase/dehydratase family protein [Candidatus Limiplasma sp.]|nr:NAD-dependent epimerase/dehydratase family protein [Candidatus Limiplasma sp.]
MTKLLITGAGSYIGGAAAAYWLAATGQSARTVDVRGEAWKEISFQGYDALLHVAGIAHRRETEEEAGEYYAVNRDLAVAVAKKAKAEGVRQFIFLSSMSVYGITTGHITAQSAPSPNTHYGRSKLQAEEALLALAGEGFAVAVLRPPMVYGKGCRGNYPRLSALVRKAPFFPKVDNRRSMLYIDCLSAFVVRLADSGRGGLFFPQNREYVSTDDLVREIARAHGKSIWQPRGFGWLIRLLASRVGVLGKLFGSLTYDQAMSRDFTEESQLDFAETIRRTEARP